MSDRLIDLSHEIEDGLITYPGLPGPRITDHLSWEASHANYAPGVEFRIARIDMIANTGTYLDTPAHRHRDGYDLSALPLSAVADVPGIVIDAAEQAVDANVFEGHELSRHAVLIRTGWDRHWKTERYGSTDHPYLTDAAVQLLVAARPAVVGIDSVNIDDTSPQGGGRRPAHSELLRAGIPIVEHLCRLDKLGDAAFRFFAVPVKVVGMATFPVRAFARIE